MVYKRGIKVRKRCEYCACSLVNKDIPSNVVAFGNPCKVIRSINEHDSEYYFKNRKINYKLII